MTHAEKDWGDGQPGDNAVDAITGARASRPDEEAVVVEYAVVGDGSGPAENAVKPAEPELADEPMGPAGTVDPVGPAGTADTAGTAGAVGPAGTAGIPGAAARRGQEPDTPLSGAGEPERFAARWQEIQAEFVDNPRKAIEDADALVADLVQRLNQMLAREREQLDPRARAGEDITTEDLRQGLQRYRALVQRLLAA
jgi:hypothetical protein